jgi:nitrogen fixation protein FixH
LLHEKAGEIRMSRPFVSPKPLTGRKVLFMLAAFFGVVIGVNLIMMKLAILTLPGTDVDSAYSASLAYENEIAAAHDQNARNWQVDAHIERAPDGGAMLQVDARDHQGRPMSGLKFKGRFERPTDRRADQPVTLAETGVGIYRGSAPQIAPGQWDLVLEGDTAGRRMFLSKNRVLLN